MRFVLLHGCYLLYLTTFITFLTNLALFMFRHATVCMVSGRRTLNKTQLSLLQGKQQRLHANSMPGFSFFHLSFYLEL
jgi:hypothetical protein